MRLAIVFLLLGTSVSLRAEVGLHKLEGKAQGSTWHLTYGGQEKPGLLVGIERELAAIDGIFSNYRADSEISRFNSQSSTDWFPVDAELVRLVDNAAAISKKSKGAFDITIGPVLRIWGFGPFKTGKHSIPSESAIAEAKKDVDYRKLVTRKVPPGLKKLNPRLHADLSGIAQGYSVDRIAAYLESQGLNQFLLEIGGEVKTKGEKSPGQPWTLGIDVPVAESNELAALLQVKDRALTTSGDYQDYFEKDGKRFSHTLDPRTGRPIEHKLASVTVLAPNAWEADGWDTAFMVMGAEETRKLLPQLKSLAVYMITREAGGFRSESLGGFEKFLKTDSRP